MIDKNNIYAVIGASTNKEKYGFKVFKDLLESGYNVIPINPSKDVILGVETYGNLIESPKKIDVVIFVTPPTVTEKVLEDARDLGIKNVWMQPGAESDNSIKFCEENGIECTYNSCIMIERKN